jgi:hypothetical protein
MAAADAVRGSTDRLPGLRQRSPDPAHRRRWPLRNSSTAGRVRCRRLAGRRPHGILRQSYSSACYRAPPLHGTRRQRVQSLEVLHPMATRPVESGQARIVFARTAAMQRTTR